MTISSEVSDLKKSMEFLKERGFERIGVLGNSLGGCVTLLAYENNMECIVLWFPAVFPTEGSRAFNFMKKHKKELENHGRVLYKEKGEERFYVGKDLYEE